MRERQKGRIGAVNVLEFVKGERQRMNRETQEG